MGSVSKLEIVIATHNPGKVREVEDALRSLPVKLHSLSEFHNVQTVAETGQTYEDNAVLKALGYARQTGLIALADDSGLEVDALGRRPGVHSARFGGPECSDANRVQLLLQELSKHQNARRSARFVCCMALAAAGYSQQAVGNVEPQLFTVTQANCEGTIAPEPRGSNGFGFDPVFIPKGFQATFGELPMDIKNKISHRAQALAEIRAFLDSAFSQT